jgi:hypothetical protein
MLAMPNNFVHFCVRCTIVINNGAGGHHCTNTEIVLQTCKPFTFFSLSEKKIFARKLFLHLIPFQELRRVWSLSQNELKIEGAK